MNDLILRSEVLNHIQYLKQALTPIDEQYSTYNSGWNDALFIIFNTINSLDIKQDSSSQP